MQLKVGINRWEDIREVKIDKVTSVADVQSVYSALLKIPSDVFAVDFVVQDFRTSKVCSCASADVLVDVPRCVVVVLDVSGCVTTLWSSHVFVMVQRNGPVGGVGAVSECCARG